MIHSSFTYKNIFQGHDVMVFIPHEDDEINVAGATIYGLKQEGFHVICVFATWIPELHNKDSRKELA